MPDNDFYGPLGIPVRPEEAVIMRVDEYETIRLIDWEGFTQEECSQNMHVARTTVQSIYNQARKKLADSLVNGKPLLIAGGSFELCNGTGRYCGGRGCRGGRRRSAGSKINSLGDNNK